MSKQIFQTDRCVLVAYSPGASGNFLINCLCFHSQFQPKSRRVFRDTQQKINFIQAQLDYQTKNSREEWRDFNMDDLRFYNVQGLWYAQGPSTPFERLPDQYLERHQQQLIQQGTGNIQQCVDQGLYFFKGLHRSMELDAYRRIWPHARVILLVNSDDYISTRYRDIDSPQPRVVTDIAQACDSVDPGLRWDCSWFLDWDAFILGYRGLLTEFGLEPENVSELQHFYQTYIDYWFPDLAS
jgi:hypothetical protein